MWLVLEENLKVCQLILLFYRFEKTCWILFSAHKKDNSWKTKVSLSLNKEQDQNKTVKVLFLLINI